LPDSDKPIKFAPADIADDMVQRLQAAGQQGDNAAWEVGELTNILLGELDAELGAHYSRASVYHAVGVWVGCAAGTVRMRAHVVAHTPRWVKAKYNELSFHQLKALIPHAPNDTDWEPAIEAWFDHCATNNVSIGSVDGLRSFLSAGPGALPPELRRYRKALSQMQLVADDDRVPKVLRDTLFACLDALAERAAAAELLDWIVERF